MLFACNSCVICCIIGWWIDGNVYDRGSEEVLCSYEENGFQEASKSDSSTYGTLPSIKLLYLI